MVEQADQSSQNGKDNYTDKFSDERQYFLEPDDKGRAAGTGGKGRLPKSPKNRKTGSVCGMPGHGNLL
jgi:hypothetical protein